MISWGRVAKPVAALGIALLCAVGVATLADARAAAPVGPGHERIPGSVHVLRISRGGSHHLVVVVTDVKKLQEIARAIDRYPLNGPGACSEGFVPPSIEFSFLGSMNGPAVARVSGVTKGFGGAFCEPTVLWVRRHGRQFLVEDGVLLKKINQILGTSLH